MFVFLWKSNDIKWWIIGGTGGSCRDTVKKMEDKREEETKWLSCSRRMIGSMGSAEQESSVISTAGRSHHTQTIARWLSAPPPIDPSSTGIYAEKIQLLSAGQQEHSSPLTSLQLLLTASAPARHRCQRWVLRELRVCRDRANGPSAAGRRPHEEECRPDLQLRLQQVDAVRRLRSQYSTFISVPSYFIFRLYPAVHKTFHFDIRASRQKYQQVSISGETIVSCKWI